MVSHRRYALRRHSTMKSGSFFRAEIARTTSSFNPGGKVSDSMSVTNPASYSRVISDSIELLIYAPQELGAADGARSQLATGEQLRQAARGLFCGIARPKQRGDPPCR